MATLNIEKAIMQLEQHWHSSLQSMLLLLLLLPMVVVEIVTGSAIDHAGSSIAQGEHGPAAPGGSLCADRVLSRAAPLQVPEPGHGGDI